MAGSHMCQHTNVMLQDYLPCKHTESGGKQCEREEAHGDEIPHYFSKHTIMHEKWGNGYACEAFPEYPVALFAEKERVKARIRNLQEYLAKLDEMPSVP